MITASRDDAAGLHGCGEVVDLLSAQRDLCVRLSGLAGRQRSLITGDEPERLLAVLAERQEILDGLGSLGERLRPYQQQWRDVRAALDAAQGQQADRLVAEVNALLADILRKDEADAQLLAARKNSTARAMADLKHTRQAGAAYAASAFATPAQTEWTDE